MDLADDSPSTLHFLKGIHEKRFYLFHSHLFPGIDGSPRPVAPAECRRAAEKLWSTATTEGRIIYSIGNWTNQQSENGRQRFTKFELDVVDTSLARRIRISRCDPLREFGRAIGIYTQSVDLIVILEENSKRLFTGLRQWLISIDIGAKTAQIVYEKAYLVNLSDHMAASIGDEIVVVSEYFSAFVLPKNPQSSTPHKEVTPLLEQATSIVAARLGDNACITDRPFIINSTLIGFFIELIFAREEGMGHADHYPQEVAVIDIITNAITVQKIKGNLHCLDSYCSLSVGGDCPDFYQANDQEVVLTVGGVDKVFAGVLKTRILELVQLQVGLPSGPHEFLPSPDGSLIVISDRVSLANNQIATTEVERYRIISSPFSAPSLLRLAAEVVKRSVHLDREEKRMIAFCFQ